VDLPRSINGSTAIATRSCGRGSRGVREGVHGGDGIRPQPGGRLPVWNYTAVGAIAETGSVILSDASTSRRLGALAPWVHVAVLRREEVFRNVAQAVALLGDDPNIIWATGPSKTADVEGILIEGVHGPAGRSRC